MTGLRRQPAAPAGDLPPGARRSAGGWRSADTNPDPRAFATGRRPTFRLDPGSFCARVIQLQDGPVCDGMSEPEIIQFSPAGRSPRAAKPGRHPVPDAMSTHLLAVAERHDRTAFAVLFRHFAPRLKSFFRRFQNDDGKIEEVLQETFVAVWTKAHQFDPSRASAATWIYTIARNQRIDAFRRERRPEFDPHDPAFVPEPEPPAEARVTSRERATHLAAALAHLSEEQREILRLSFFEDSSHNAIASRLGVPVGTVKSRIRLAYGHLRSQLASVSGELL